MPEAAEEKQDLHIAEPRLGDRSWARMQPVQIIPSRERLDLPHQVVSIKNTSEVQRHIVIDRGMQGHELQPGETKHGIEMVNSEIEYFLRQRMPGRKDPLGNPFPPHPIEIIGAKLPGEERRQAPKAQAA